MKSEKINASANRQSGERGAGNAKSLPRTAGPRAVLLAVALIAMAGAIFYEAADHPARSAGTSPSSPAAVRIDSAIASTADVPLYIEGLGTVQGFNTVTITPRVDGQLLSLGFVEGQIVKPGDILAQIDPRPYQAVLDQAKAVKVKDEAQLANARRDLARYQTLAPEDLASKQTLETQRAQVSQLEAQVGADQALVDSATTNLDYTTIRSPIQGRAGIRLTDAGNIVRAAASTGIVVITQVNPITVLVSLPAKTLRELTKAMASGPVEIKALSREDKSILGMGTIGVIDTQIDQTTGTLRLKAIFPNRDNRLWPGDFVNARMLLRTRHNALTIPSTAVQRGPNGVFAYVVKDDGTVEMRSIESGEEAGAMTVVENGLEAGERVATSNQYRLQPGAHVQIAAVQGESDGGVRVHTGKAP